jgi:hypothetical protein
MRRTRGQCRARNAPGFDGRSKKLVSYNTPERWRLEALAVLTVGAVLVFIAPPDRATAAPSAARPLELTVTCPGPQCPYTPPTSAEQGSADDVLARMNLERAAPERAYTYDGAETSLSPLAPADPTAEMTAQAAAEWEATNNTVSDYGGPNPTGYTYATGGNATGAADSASIDSHIMSSYGHALSELSAAPTEVAVGAACSTTGTLYVIEEFFDTTRTQWQTGQAHFQAELSENNVFVQSGGKEATVTDTEGTGPAQDYLPQLPIVAGDGPGTDERIATGVDWTCKGAKYPPGSSPASALPAPITGMASSRNGGGYALVDAAGAISVHGDAAFHGSAAGLDLSQPVRRISETPDGGGYWLVAADGGVFAFGDAGYFGSMGGTPLNAPVVDMAPTPDGGGYWLVAADGGVFAFGDATFWGSMGGRSLNAPVVGIAASPDGGYWLVAADGGVFAFGTTFDGSAGSIHLNRPVVGISTSHDGGGYWLVASDGGVFCFGDATFLGSTGDLDLVAPVVGMAADTAGGGYWLVASDGGVFSFGAPFYGAD